MRYICSDYFELQHLSRPKIPYNINSTSIKKKKFSYLFWLHRVLVALCGLLVVACGI